MPGVRDTFAIAGYSGFTGVNASNAGTMFVVLDDFKKRKGHPEFSAGAITGKLMGAYSQIQEGFALVFPPPPVRGVGTAGGFKMQVEDRTGRASPQELQATVEEIIAEARKNPKLSPQLLTTFRANVPQLYVNVDRAKAKMQDVQITDIFQTLQVYLGGLYVNDFNYLGRTYRVMAQSDSPFRARASDIAQLKTRNANDEMVPLGAVMQVQDTVGPDRINRYNLYQSAEINGSSIPGVSTGEALNIMEDLFKRDFAGKGYSFEWTDLAFQEKEAGNTAFYIFPLCVLFVWLVHSAEYESFALSTAIILIVPMCLLCGIAGVMLRGLDNNIFTQIGFVVLAGLSAKNAVLIVEFAKQQQEHGKNAVEAALEAARLRLRPILMTSFAFILGVLPLVVAEGAGSEMRQALGTTVFFGMLGVTFFGLFLTPVFFVSIRWVTDRFFNLTHHHHAQRQGPGHGHGGDGHPQPPPAHPVSSQ
jgi:multidrug efflux pump subunit AcrB